MGIWPTEAAKTVKGKAGTQKQVLALYARQLNTIGVDTGKMHAILDTPAEDIDEKADMIEEVCNSSKVGNFLFAGHKHVVAASRLEKCIREGLAELKGVVVTSDLLLDKKRRFLARAEAVWDEPKGKRPIKLAYRGVKIPGHRAPPLVSQSAKT